MWTLSEVLQLISAVVAAMAAILLAWKTNLVPALIARANANIKNKKEQQELQHKHDLHQAHIDFAADRRISSNLKYIIAQQAKSLTEHERKLDAQQSLLMICVEDRAALRTKVNLLEDEIKKLRNEQ